MPILKSTEEATPRRGKQKLRAYHLEDGTELYPLRWAAKEIGVNYVNLMARVEQDSILKNKCRKFHLGTWYAIWPAFKLRYLKHAMLKGPKRNRPIDGDLDPDAGPDEMTFHDASTRSAAYKAELLKLEYEKEAGLLLPKEKVLLAWQGIANLVMKAMLSIPDRVSAILASEMNTDAVHAKLTKEIRVALTNLNWEEQDVSKED